MSCQTFVSTCKALHVQTHPTLGSLSSDVFERRTSTGSEPFSLVISLYATVFVLPSVLILKGTICPKICSEARLKCAKSLFPVDVRRSKTSLLKLPNVGQQLPTLLNVTCSVCLHILSHVVGSCCAKFETGQTFEPTTPNISFVL